jgi:hypothetical protein
LAHDLVLQNPARVAPGLEGHPARLCAPGGGTRNAMPKSAPKNFRDEIVRANNIILISLCEMSPGSCRAAA